MSKDDRMSTLGEIISSFTDKCSVRSNKCDYSEECLRCDYAHIDEVSMCERQYIYDVAAGIRDINDSFLRQPSWLKCGRWVAVRGDYLKRDFDDLEHLYGDEWYSCLIEAIDTTPPSEVVLELCRGKLCTCLSEPLEDFISGDDRVVPIEEPIPAWLYKGAELWRTQLHAPYRIDEFTPRSDGYYEIKCTNLIDGYQDESDFLLTAFTPVRPSSAWIQVGEKVETQDGKILEVKSLDYDEDSTDHRIYAITDDGNFFLDELSKPKPVKFRPYKSLEELEALLGKKLRIKQEVMGGGSIAVETITSVEYDSFDGSTTINLRPYSFYTKEATTTIDGLPIGVPVVDEELPAAEVEAITREAFYEKNPEFRPAQEQVYDYCVTVHRKWSKNADFCDEPFIVLTAQSTKDKIHSIADLNEEILNEDYETTMLIEHDVGKIFADCIENRWLEGNNFRDEHIVEKTCSYGDKHEFLIVVTIDEVN